MRLLTAVITPFFSDFRIDFVSLERILRLQDFANNGIVLLGSTGESLSLSLEEKQQILDFVCSLNLQSALYVGVSGASFQEALDWIELCNSFPISGFLMTSPIYAKPGFHGQTLWFEALLNKAKRSAILYNIPSRAGTPLYIETVQALADHECFFGVKDSGGSLESFKRYQECASHLKIFCGDDSLWPEMAAGGSYGLISVAANAWARETHNYVQNPHPHALWQELCSWLSQATNPLPIKYMLAHLGYITSPTVRPPLSLRDFSQERSLGSIIEKMRCWKDFSLAK
ncbi:4-hydroxy-tetrahydrodipicolinate synthase [Chlamydia sp. 17-3921]|uniref:4-hydroxy-tetrahydrodipicolinate synthase n=1 Tax=Chlamydia sp. 17-3921 TaxID=2675798 RepID=UPI00191AE95E|nr:4-hydroxy-tetrahydrodipicolinate synthase [Chlamydia sp. 17-3921]